MDNWEEERYLLYQSIRFLGQAGVLMALKNQVEHYARKFELTEREMEVFYYLVNRNVNPAVLGKKLNISLHTVNNHLKKILEKTHSESKTELLADFLLFLDKQKSGLDLPLLHPRVLILL